jgi:hypothetical protein
MNDHEAQTPVHGRLTRARDALGGVRMDLPATAIMARGRARQRRRWRAGGTFACAALAVGALLTQTLPAGGPATSGTGVAKAQTVAYVVRHVENAFANERLVFYGRTSSNTWGPTATWVYGHQNRFEELTGAACGHTTASGDCTHRGGSVPYLAQGTALVHGRLTGAYVSYWDQRYSLSPVYNEPPNACSTQTALTMGGPPPTQPHWSSFVHATLACGVASVTGHVRVDGQETTRITGRPVTVRLSPAYSKVIHAKWVKAEWTWYVNPTTYLPVQIDGATITYGGSAGRYTSSSVTDVRWLPPTRANIAKTLVTIPAGFHRWTGNPGNQ